MGTTTLAAITISRDGEPTQQCYLEQKDFRVCPLAPLCPVGVAAFPGIA